MSTPQFFEIPSTGIYRSPDGSVSYYYAEGAIIPMSLAIALGIEGAEYDAVPVFDAAQVAAIEALIAESGGGGGGSTFPMGEGFWYDNLTVLHGSDTTFACETDTIAFVPILVTASGVSITAVETEVYAEVSGTVRVAIYDPNTGDKVGDVGDETWVTSFDDDVLFTCDIPVSPGYYLVGYAGTTDTTIAGFTTSSGSNIGILGHEVGNQSPYLGLTIPSVGAHTAMPSTVAFPTYLGNATYMKFTVPWCNFQITYD